MALMAVIMGLGYYFTYFWGLGKPLRNELRRVQVNFKAVCRESGHAAAGARGQAGRMRRPGRENAFGMKVSRNNYLLGYITVYMMGP